MSDDPQEINVNVGFNRQPPKRRRWSDCFWICVAAALIATASGQAWLFGVVAGVGIALYLASDHIQPKDDQPQQ